MFRTIAEKVFCFDVEWIPDPLTGELLYGVEHNPPFSYEESFRAMWADAGATPEKPRPFVKTVLCRIVSIAGVFRDASSGKPDLKLVSLPANPADPKWDERHILESFLKAVGGSHPQLVGFNSNNADIPIIVQRSIIHGLDSHGFAERPEKPWLGVDYFSSSGEGSVDLGQILGRWGSMPRLDEIATLSGIPGKIDVHGDNVWNLWLQGRLQEIVNYNEFDALTTYLLWARMAHFAGLLNDSEYEAEQQALRELVERELASGKTHMQRYLNRWDELKKKIAERRAPEAKQG
jgi:predicted PolB exonuclease-like 3'-5' exonuclease